MNKATARFMGRLMGIGQALTVKCEPLTQTGRVILDIEAERLRQIRKEGWTSEHDDEHELGEMAMAAASYAQKSTEDYAKYPNMIPPDNWPWGLDWWKPKNPRRDLVRAAALLVAEIERLDRAGKQQTGWSNR